MEKELGTSGAVVGMFVLASLFGALALAIYPGWPAIGAWANRADAPAWVQAVGSIAAILAAAAIAGWQASSARREFLQRQCESNEAKALAIKYILRRVSLIVANAQRASLSNAGAKALAAEQVTFIQSVLRALPVFEIPSAELVFNLQRVDRDLFYVAAIIERAADREVSGRKVDTSRLVLRIQRRLNEAVVSCDSVINRKV